MPTNIFSESILVIISSLLEYHMIKQTPITGDKVKIDGWSILWLKNKIEWTIKTRPINGNIGLSFFDLLLLPDLISKYANKEPANSSQTLVWIK